MFGICDGYSPTVFQGVSAFPCRLAAINDSGSFQMLDLPAQSVVNGTAAATMSDSVLDAFEAACHRGSGQQETFSFGANQLYLVDRAERTCQRKKRAMFRRPPFHKCAYRKLPRVLLLPERLELHPDSPISVSRS
jgi:hypothetical protein